MGDFTTLSLDLGSTIGYAVGKSGVIVESGEVNLHCKDTHPGHRFLRFQQWLSNYRHVDEVLFEDVMNFASGPSAKLYGALFGVMSVFSLAYRIRMRGMNPMTIKKEFAGHGHAKKEEMCEVAMKLGWKNGVLGTPNNNNEADAIALLWVIYVRSGIEPTFIKV